MQEDLGYVARQVVPLQLLYDPSNLRGRQVMPRPRVIHRVRGVELPQARLPGDERAERLRRALLRLDLLT